MPTEIVLALLLSAIAHAHDLADLAGRLGSGQEPTPEDHELLKRAQAIEEARTDALTGHGPSTKVKRDPPNRNR